MHFIFRSVSCTLYTYHLPCLLAPRPSVRLRGRHRAVGHAQHRGKGGEDDGGRHAQYPAAWDHLSGPLRFVQSARPGPAAVSVPGRGHPGRLAAPLRDRYLVDPSGWHRTPARPDGGPAPRLLAGADAGVFLPQPLWVTDKGTCCRSLRTSAALLVQTATDQHTAMLLSPARRCMPPRPGGRSPHGDVQWRTSLNGGVPHPGLWLYPPRSRTGPGCAPARPVVNRCSVLHYHRQRDVCTTFPRVGGTPLLHAYRLLYRESLDAPDSLWEWHQPWIDHLLWHARTFRQQVVHRYFATWQFLDQANTRLWERTYAPAPAMPSGPPGTRGWSTTANCWSSHGMCTKATMASEGRHGVCKLWGSVAI